MNTIQKSLIITSLLTIAIFVTAAWFYQKRITLDEQLLLNKHLHSKLDRTHHALTSWAKEKKHDTQRWADEALIVQTANKLLKLKHSTAKLISSLTQKTLRQWLHPVISNTGYLGYFIIGPDNINLASSRDQNIGITTLLANQAFFLHQVRSGKTALSLPLTSDVMLTDEDGIKKSGLPTMFVGAPIFDESNNVIAIFIFRIDPKNKFDTFFKSKELNIFEEIYAYSGSGILLSDSLNKKTQPNSASDINDSNLVLNLQVNKSNEIKTKFKKLLEYTSYRDKPVIGISLWDENLAMGIAIEVAKNDAYHALNEEKKYITLTVVLLSLIILFGAALTQFYLALSRQKQQTESEERARILMNTVVEGIITYDTYGSILSMNSAAESIFGYQYSEIVNSNIGTLICGNQQDLLSDLYAPKSRRSRRELTGIKKSGVCFPLEFAIDITENVPNPTFTAITRDLSDQKEKERELLIKDAALESALNAILVIDNKGIITYANPSMLSQWKLNNKNEIIGQATGVLLKNPQKVNEIHNSVTLKGSWAGELEAARSDGSCFFIRLSASAIKDKDNNIVSLMGICENITERKTAEAKMLKAKESAEKANQTKTEFITRISHELRTPLNAVIGFAKLFELDETLSQDQFSQAHEITKAGEHLVALINDLLDLAIIESGKIKILKKNIDITSLLNECKTLITPSLKNNNLHIDFDTDSCVNCCVSADPLRLKQVLLNLLSNAVKYNSPDGKIGIQCQTQGSRLRINIIDTGPGIPQENQHKIFHAFDRLGAEQSKIEGSGIGLMISKQIMELMDGSLCFVSTPGAGSTFWVDINLSTNPDRIVCSSKNTSFTRASNSTREDATILHQAQILVAEDNVVNQLVMRKQLKYLGYDTVTFANNGVEAYELWQSNRYDILLTDINMPKMNGYELTAQIRHHEQTSGKPTTIIAITANAEISERSRCLAIGMDNFIAKPVNIMELKTLLNNWEDENPNTLI